MTERLTKDQLDHLERIALTPHRSLSIPTLQLRQLVREHRDLREALREACSLATTPLPEDRERILELYAMAGGARL